MQLYDSFGRKVTPGMAQFVDQVMKVRGATTAPWPGMDLCMKFWEKQNPTRYNSFLMDIRDTRETRLDSRFGLSKNKSMRYTLDIPQEVILMIRKIYNTDELVMDRRFYQEFAKRYPECKIAERQ